ncbi:MAG TPA: hypothetical protein VFE31_15415 [Opitutaceae bacterium]|nr:hypothetical protein [Opitutaceae bacterium]
MSLLDRLERHFGRFALPGIPLIIVAGQVLAWFALLRGLIAPGALVFYPPLVLAGQWWRLVTFLFAPPPFVFSPFPWGILAGIFAWWLFYFMGAALEGFWGAFRFNAFLFVGYVFTVGAGFLEPSLLVSNLFLGGSVFLAFAYLNPNFEMLLFLIVPVRIKWLALLTWAAYAYEVLFAPVSIKLQVLASVINFFLFFGRDLYLGARLKTRAVSKSAARRATARAADEPRHRCRVCGRTDKTNPELDFRYCSRCAGEQCYCSEHIFNHTHVTAEDEAVPHP